MATRAVVAAAGRRALIAPRSAPRRLARLGSTTPSTSSQSSAAASAGHSEHKPAGAEHGGYGDGDHHGEHHDLLHPPMNDSLGIIFEDPQMDPRVNPEVPYTLDESEGVAVIKFTDGPFKDEEVVICKASPTLEFALPSPPPLHCFEEPPIIKEHPEEFEDHWENQH